MIGIRSLHHKLIRRMLRNRRVGGGDDTGREADPVLYVCWHGGSRIPNEQQTGRRLRIYPAGSRTSKMCVTTLCSNTDIVLDSGMSFC
mmetsp:Transcript_6/g.47  ORF Transcript_6/g.47 Transcript_6/m.47 type:complete len:88 (-) Transcript_6:759-1022(-)